MTPAIIATLEKLLDGPRDSALLRYSLGTEWLKAGDPARAAAYYRQAVAKDPHYSAAWKGLGRALADGGDDAGALAAWHEGVAVATARGDVQAAREMAVFTRRSAKALAQKQTAGGTQAPPADDAEPS